MDRYAIDYAIISSQSEDRTVLVRYHDRAEFEDARTVLSLEASEDCDGTDDTYWGENAGGRWQVQIVDDSEL